MTVLQLLPTPLEALVEVKRLLAPGGTVLIVLPNQDGLLNQLNLLIGKKRQKRFGTLVFPYHLHAFTPKTLTLLIARAGLNCM
jgi:SAM-dependent methyltransferase